MKAPLDIVSVGGISAVGACSAVSAAAVRAGTSRTQLLTTRSEVEGHVARVSAFEPDAKRVDRARELLRAALRECAVGFEAQVKGERFEVPLFVVLPADLRLSDLVRPEPRDAGLTWSSVQAAGSGHAAGLEALSRVAEALGSGAVEIACLAGVDVQCDDASVEALAVREKLFASGNPWGFVPGEAAGALLFATEAACKRLRLATLGRIRGLGRDAESGESTQPNTGRALSVACHAALDALSGDARAADIYCDLNGERARSDEWGFTAPRLAPRCRDAGEAVVPAQSWGDVGSASGPLLVQLALAAFARGYARGKFALVWAASESGPRAAALVERCDARPQSPPMAAVHAQDAGLLREFFGEASFLYELRAQYLSDLERDPAPEHSAPAVASLEHRLEAQIDGVILGGREARSLLPSLTSEPGDVYATVRALAAHASSEELVEYLAGLDARDVRAAAASALSHAGASAKLVPPLLTGGGHLTALGLQLAADSGKPPEVRWPVYAKLDPEVLQSSFPVALMRHGQGADAEALLEPWFASADEALQLAAAWAFLRLDLQRARRALWSRLERPGIATALAAICQPGEQSVFEERLAAMTDDALACQALGVLGTSKSIVLSLRRFASAPDAAARAIHRVTGVAVFEEYDHSRVMPDEALTHPELLARRAGDVDVGVERVRLRRFSREAAAWEAACAKRVADLPEQSRLCLGQPLSAAALLRAVEHPLLAPTEQSVAAAQLYPAFGVALELRHDARVSDRLAGVASARATVRADA